MNLKNQLRFLLDHRGMSAADLSRKAEVSKQVISLWLSGAKPRNVDQIKKVADALDVTVDHLLFGDGEDREAEKITAFDTLTGDGWVGGIFEVKFRRVKK